MRRTNTAGRELIKECEGCKLVAYMPTPHDVWTLGVGHTRGVQRGDICSIGQAELWLSADLRAAEKCVIESVKVPLNDNEFAALVSFTFNLGCGALLGSTLLKVLNEGKYVSAAEEFSRWNKQRNKNTGVMTTLDGLTVRRKKEKELFLCPVST